MVRATGWTYDYRDDYAEMITALTSDGRRNAMILEDLHAETAEPKRRAVVVSERREHLKLLASGLVHRYVHGRLQILFVTTQSLEKI